LEYDYEIDIEDCGVVVNRIDVRKKQAREMVEWINAAFDDVPVWQVRERADVQKALDAGVSLLQYNPDCDMCEVFRDVAAGLDDQFGLEEPEVEA
jgi:chromosome partitioning protein